MIIGIYIILKSAIPSVKMFRKTLLKFIMSVGTIIFYIRDNDSVEFLLSFGAGFHYRRKHKFRYNLKNAINLLCSCSIEVEQTSPSLKSQHFYDIYQASLINELLNHRGIPQ